MTAVFSLKQVGSSLERLSCSVQSLAIDSCVVAQAEQTAINLAPPFSCSLEIAAEEMKGNAFGLQELAMVFNRHFAEVRPFKACFSGNTFNFLIFFYF